jgi:membrane protein
MDRLRTGPLAPLAPALARIRRSDPFLMAAAIAYNTFFALVPLTIALVAGASIIGRSDDSLGRFQEAVTAALPPEVAEFIVDLISDTAESLGGAQGYVIAISLAIALYSGSRAVYATTKALRLIQDGDDDRGYVVVRGLGILFTLGAGIALVVGQVLVLAGTDVMRMIAEWTGAGSIEDIGGAIALPVLAVWTAALLAAIYRWGPPRPSTHPAIAGLVAALLLGVASWLFGIIIPRLGLSTVGILGTVGVVLLWTYTMALIVIIVPELIDAIGHLVRRGSGVPSSG